MDKSQYLNMIDEQMREAKETMNVIEKSYIEAKAKYEALRDSKESYIRWVMGDEELNYDTK